MATTQSLCQGKPSPVAVAKPLPSNRVENEKMKRIKAKFQVVTPCFLGGANHKDETELRLPSIKGALRFWWRTLNYAPIAKGAANPNKIIENLREKEGKLFGSSEQGKGQSLLIMRLNAESQSLSEIKARKVLCYENSKEVVGVGARYLGYGVMETIDSWKKGTKAGELTRPCLKSPFEFTLQIGAKEQKHLDEILPALKLLGLLGGLGSKSRKGYGSLNLIELKGDGVDTWQKPADENKYQDRLIELLKPARDYGEEPKISAFSSKARIYLFEFKSRNSAMEVLNEYGEEMIRYRSWGRNGKILNGQPSEKNFKKDHDWAKGIKRFSNFHPRRAVFGLPHNYGKGVGVEPRNPDYGRRASPLFFHVHKIGNEFVGVALLLRSQFLPKGEKISANREPVSFDSECWEVLEKFMDRIRKKSIWPQ